MFFAKKQLIVRVNLVILLVLGGFIDTKAQNPPDNCPQSLETLTDDLLKDLPAYANRVIQRSRLSNDSFDNSYIILAGRPEFEPLPLQTAQYQPIFPDATEQLFFTTLERHYRTQQAVTFQSFHWVFFSKIKGKWQLIKVLSQLTALESESIPLPPEDTTNGVIGQGIRLWLRDCNTVRLSKMNEKRGMKRK